MVFFRYSRFSPRILLFSCCDQLFRYSACSSSFNFFHTEPYLSLRIHGSADLVTFGLLAAVGMMAGSLAGSALLDAHCQAALAQHDGRHGRTAARRQPPAGSGAGK